MSIYYNRVFSRLTKNKLGYEPRTWVVFFVPDIIQQELLHPKQLVTPGLQILDTLENSLHFKCIQNGSPALKTTLSCNLYKFLFIYFLFRRWEGSGNDKRWVVDVDTCKCEHVSRQTRAKVPYYDCQLVKRNECR